MKTVKSMKPRGKAARTPHRGAALVGRTAAVAGSVRARWGRLSRRARLTAAGTTAAVVVAVVAALVFWPQDPSGPPDPRARVYADFDACLLTGEAGITAGTPAAPVWAGMQKASGETKARVSYYPVNGEQTEANARLFLNSVLQRGCDVVLAVGAPQVAAVEAGAKGHADVRFAVVDAKRSPSGGVSVLRPGDGLPDSVAEIVTEAFDKSR